MGVISTGYLIKGDDKSTIYEDNDHNRRIPGVRIFTPDPDEFPVLFKAMIARSDKSLIIPRDEEESSIILPEETGASLGSLLLDLKSAKAAGVPVVEQKEKPINPEINPNKVNIPETVTSEHLSFEEASTKLEVLKNHVNEAGVKGWKGLNPSQREKYVEYAGVVNQKLGK